MDNTLPLIFAEKGPHYKLDSIRFLNLTLDQDRIKYIFDPIIKSMCKNIEFSFKSPVSVELISTAPTTCSQLINCLQFDDLCIRLFHLDSAKDFFLIVPSRFARNLLMKLLSTSLVDDQAHLLFSSTEKGIFSFIMARLISEMKKMIGDFMPNLKLIGIFHAMDEAINDFKVSHYGACNFIMNFAGENFPIAVFCPTEIFELGSHKPTSRGELFSRCGHLNKPLSFKINRLKMHLKTLYGLSFGDLILFDHADLKLNDGRLEGDVKASWQGIWLDGSLSIDAQNYYFRLNGNVDDLRRVNDMEELEITGSNHAATDNNRLLTLAKNLRVEISIELSRVMMSLKEICDLRAGEIIDLHRKIDDPLEIVLDNKVIGFCTPVQIEGRLGIRILSIESSLPPTEET